MGVSVWSRVITLMGGCLVASAMGQGLPSPAIDLCTVATNIRTYSGQQVRLTAFLGHGAEQDVLYDPKCQDGQPLVYVTFEPKVSGQMKDLRRILKKKHYALVTVDGTMRGAEHIRIDPKLPAWIKDRFKDSMKQYGHLGSLDMMIEIDRIVEAKDVDDGWRPSAGSKTSR